MSDEGFSPSGNEKIGKFDDDRAARYPSVSKDLNVLFSLLMDERRRYVLYHLHDIDGSVTDVGAAIDAVCEYEAAANERDSPKWGDVQTELYHIHLPLLSDRGVIDYDQRQGTIRSTEQASLEEWVEHAQYEELE